MSNFTKADFNTIMNYLEHKISRITDDRMKEVTATQSMLQDRAFLCKLQYYYELMGEVKNDFCYGLFKNELEEYNEKSVDNS